MNIDCMDYLPSIKDEKIQLIVTSPPYNLNKEYEEKMNLNDYLYQQKQVIKELARIIKPTGSICYQVGFSVDNKEVYPLDCLLYSLFKEEGLQLRNRIIWTFNHGLHAKHRLSGRHETILWFTKSDDYVFNLDPIRVPQKYPNKKAYKGKNKGQLSCNPLGKNPGDVWDITNIKAGHSEKTEHPCQFPEELVRRLVLGLSHEKDMVLDPFSGSGTVGVVCEKLNREYLLLEKEAKYCEIADKRIQKVKAQKVLI